MSDRKKMPVSGGGPAKGQPDGVSASPETGKAGNVHGRSGGGESAGGAYPSPHGGSSSPGGFPEHGGQSEHAYYGGGNPNATTAGSRPDGSANAEGNAAPVREPRSVTAGAQSFEVVEDSGVATAEASGMTAADAPDQQEEHRPDG